MATTYTALGCTNPILERFEPAGVLGAIERERATTCLLVPTMLRMVLDDPALSRHDLSSLRLVFYGGGPMPLPVLRRGIEEIGCGFTQGYGLTETIEATFLVARDHALDGEPARERRLASAGREAVNAEVRVVDPLDDDVPPGEIGEILVRSPSVIREYWRAPQLTADTIRDGWFHTGDAGYRDEDGYLFVVDRIKDVIISGGENVYPKDVEDVLYAHPAVREVAVIGAPDETWGEVVTAVVVAREPVEPGALIEHCRTRLAGYKRPRAVRFVDALPRNPSGKILKRELRA
jgi:long-chain acyl-CoA synthetase